MALRLALLVASAFVACLPLASASFGPLCNTAASRFCCEGYVLDTPVYRLATNGPTYVTNSNSNTNQKQFKCNSDYQCRLPSETCPTAGSNGGARNAKSPPPLPHSPPSSPSPPSNPPPSSPPRSISPRSISEPLSEMSAPPPAGFTTVVACPKDKVFCCKPDHKVAGAVYIMPGDADTPSGFERKLNNGSTEFFTCADQYTCVSRGGACLV